MSLSVLIIDDRPSIANVFASVNPQNADAIDVPPPTIPSASPCLPPRSSLKSSRRPCMITSSLVEDCADLLSLSQKNRGLCVALVEANPDEYSSLRVTTF